MKGSVFFLHTCQIQFYITPHLDVGATTSDEEKWGQTGGTFLGGGAAHSFNSAKVTSRCQDFFLGGGKLVGSRGSLLKIKGSGFFPKVFGEITLAHIGD